MIDDSVDLIFWNFNYGASHIFYKKGNTIIHSCISGTTLYDSYIVGHIDEPIRNK